ncbi:MAG: sodium:calcium antiporter [Proteocatella sp.]
MIYALYLILALAVVLVSIRLSYYVDLLDRTTNISGAFIGGVMLAAVTSLPELFTSISATLFVNQPDLVLGNVLGSNIFNLFVLGSLIFFSIKNFNKCFLSPSHKNTLIATIIMYLLVASAVIFPANFYILKTNPVSIVILIIYLVAVKLMSSDDSKGEDSLTIETHITKNQILIRFGLLSIMLVIVSVFLTMATDIIAEKLNLGMTIAGALLLGVATSLPELTSSISLVKMKNFNATVGNIVGSNLFNFSILFIADVSYRGGSIYSANSESTNLIIFGIISTLAALLALQFKSKPNKCSSNTLNIIYGISSFIIIASYIIFLKSSI